MWGWDGVFVDICACAAKATGTGQWLAYGHWEHSTGFLTGAELGRLGGSQRRGKLANNSQEIKQFTHFWYYFDRGGNKKTEYTADFDRISVMPVWWYFQGAAGLCIICNYSQFYMFTKNKK